MREPRGTKLVCVGCGPVREPAAVVVEAPQKEIQQPQRSNSEFIQPTQRRLTEESSVIHQEDIKTYLDRATEHLATLQPDSPAVEQLGKNMLVMIQVLAAAQAL
jgi:hypothetical protein